MSRRAPGSRWDPIDPLPESPARWSVPIARIGRMELRVHALIGAWFGLVAVRMLAGPLVGDAGPRSATLLAVGAVSVLAAMLIHEAGRLLVAARFDAVPASASLWPLGTLEDLPSRAGWRPRAASAAGGLLAVLFAGGLVGLVLFRGTGIIGGVVLPWPGSVTPPGLLLLRDGTQPAWLIGLHEFQRGLMTMLLLQLVPMSPLAGGRLLEAAMIARHGRRAARRPAVQLQLVAAGGLLLGSTAAGGWLGVLAAMVGGVSAAAGLARMQAEARGASEAGDPAGPGPEEIPLAAPPSPGPGRDRGIRGGPGGRLDLVAGELSEESRTTPTTSPSHPDRVLGDPDDLVDPGAPEDADAQLDEVLAKIARSGIHSLLEHERRLLHRETERRNRVP
jgi:hypothetical protein